MFFRSKIVLIAALAFCSPLFAAADSFSDPDNAPVLTDCPASIINGSNKDWTFIFLSNTPITFIDLPDGCTLTHCVIPAHTTVHFTYPLTTEDSSMSIEDSTGERKMFKYKFSEKTACGYQYICHEGPTGGVSLNETAWGSIVIEGDHW